VNTHNICGKFAAVFVRKLGRLAPFFLTIFAHLGLLVLAPYTDLWVCKQKN